MKWVILAAMLACAYASPIQLFTVTGTPIPTVLCPNSLCTGRAKGNYVYPTDPRYFFSCDGLGNTVGCQRCPEGLLFNEICNQCRLPADVNSPNCETYTGTTVPNTVCTDADNKYAIWFCQNLQLIYGAAYLNRNGDFAYNVHAQTSPYTLLSNKPTYYISCVEGMYGWCRFCPAKLIWKRIVENGIEKLDCGLCDWP